MDIRVWNRIIKGKHTIYDALIAKKNYDLPDFKCKCVTEKYLMQVVKGQVITF